MKEYKFPVLIVMLGAMSILCINTQIRDEIFFSEDGGMKALMIKEYVAGNYSNTFPTDAAPKWAQDLWNNGLYYFRTPFVYDMPGGKTSVFPPFFSILSTPFYQVFGFRGLYVIPGLSLVVLWLLFALMSKHVRADIGSSSVILFVFIFGSSLTFYASVFWEHTLAALCSFFGLIWIVMSRNDSLTAFTAAFFGVSLGLSVWFRPEATFVVAPVFLIALYQLWIKRSHSTIVFVLSIVATTTLLLLYNYSLYGSVSGLHSRQIIDGSIFLQRVSEASYIFAVLIAKTIIYDPIIIFVVVAVTLLRREVVAEVKNGNLLLLHISLVVIVFFLSAPFILPNTGGKNWGIRYALVITPFIYFMALVLLGKVENHPYRKIISSLLIIGSIYGFAQNSIRGTWHLLENYGGGKANAIEYLRDQKPDVLLVTKSYQAGEFETFMSGCLFFQTDTDESFTRFLSTPEVKGKKILLLFDEADEIRNPLKLNLTDYKEIVNVATFKPFKIYEVNPAPPR